MAHDVFVSYATSDKLTADAACAILERSGVRVWIAPRDIMPGADWAESIVEAIDSCRLMVIVFSDNANKSGHLFNEVQRAFDHSIPLLPLRIEDTPPSKRLGLFISSRHWLDALTPPMELHLTKLAETIHRWLGSEAKAVEEPPPSAPVTPAVVPPLAPAVPPSVAAARPATSGAAAGSSGATPSPPASPSKGQSPWLAAIPVAVLVAFLAWSQYTPEEPSGDDESGRVATANGDADESATGEGDAVDSESTEAVPDDPVDAIDAGEIAPTLPWLSREVPTTPMGIGLRDLGSPPPGGWSVALLNETDALGLIAKSEEELAAERFDPALEFAKQAVEAAPDHPQYYDTRSKALAARSKAYAEKGEIEAAIADAGEAIKLEPENADHYANRASLYRTMGKTTEEVADLRKAVELDRWPWESEYHLAQALFKLEQYDEALSTLEALEGAPVTALLPFPDLPILLIKYRAAAMNARASQPSSAD